MTQTMAVPLLSATTSVLMIPWDRRWATSSVHDTTHAMEPGRRRALCGEGPGEMPDGRVYPAPQHQGAVLCPACWQKARARRPSSTGAPI